jgi:hypothetical protein
MSTIANLSKEDRLSYSKVREMTRVVDVVQGRRPTKCGSRLPELWPGGSFGCGPHAGGGTRFGREPGQKRSRWNARAVAGVCHIDGVGSIGAATAQKLPCDNPVLGAIIDRLGKVLALGRTRRLLWKTLRQALMIRDGMCRSDNH